MIAVALALAPCLAIAGFIYHRDKFQKEPYHALIVSFFLGVLSIVPAIVLELIWTLAGIGTTGLWDTLFYAFIVIGFSEELAKYFMLRRYVYEKPFFDEPFDGIVYGVMVSMGFAAAENVLYVLEGGVNVGVVRMFTAVPAHAVFGIMMGYFMGFSAMGKNKLKLRLTGLTVATFFHGLYDFFLFQNLFEGKLVGAIVSLVIGALLSLRAIKIHQRRSPFRTNPPV